MPHSGTSTLLHQMLHCSQKDYPISKGLDVFSTVLFKDSIRDDGHFVILNKSEDEPNAMLLYSLSKFLLTKQLKLLPEVCQSEVPEFRNDEVKKQFLLISSKLKDNMQILDSNQALSKKVALSKLQSFISFCDVNINKAVNEFAFLIARKCNRGLLVFVLDIAFYTIESLKKKFDLSHDFYESKYREEEIQFLKSFIMIEYFMDTLRAMFSKENDRNKTIVVATHKQKLESTVDLEEKIDKLKKYFDEVLGQFGMASIPNIVTIFSDDEITKLLKELILRVRSNFGDNHYVKLKFMFYHSVLQSTGQLYITKEKAIMYGKDCGLDHEEIMEFFDLFQDSCFILQFDDYVILRIQEFFQGIEKIYYFEKRGQDKVTQDIKNGLYSHNLCCEIWKDYGKNTKVCDFYVSIFRIIGLIVKVKPAISGSPAIYFMPSNRSDYYMTKVTHESASLIIMLHTAYLPLHMQCMFVEEFKAKDKMDSFEIMDSSYCNATKIRLIVNGEPVKIAFIFFPKYIEVSIGIENETTEKNKCSVYSTVKTHCVVILNRIRKDDIPNLRYNFSIVCPRSKADKPHVIDFFRASIQTNFTCKECKNEGGKAENEVFADEQRNEDVPIVKQSKKLFSDEQWKHVRFYWVKSDHAGCVTHMDGKLIKLQYYLEVWQVWALRIPYLVR